MTELSRVVWSEGMHLAQHHFQAQSRYVEDSIHFALSQLFYMAYGLAGAELDAEALRNGTVSLVHARGVMPDGLAFNIPQSDPPPAPLEIRELFSPTQHSHLVLLTIPPYRRGAPNCEPGDAAGAANGVRYRAESSPVLDETTGRDERAVARGRKNFRLVLGSGAPTGRRAGDDVSLAIARVRRDGSGHFLYDADYIPPCLQIGTSARVLEMLTRLVEILDAKSDSLRGGAPPAGGGRPSGPAPTGDVATFWLLHAVHSAAAALRHHLHVRRTHPEQLYADLARLAGALCTFSLDSHPRDLPAYAHEDLEGCFGALDRHIRGHLELTVPTSALRIPLERSAPYLHTGRVADPRCFAHGARWVLGVRAGEGAAAEAAVVTRVPQLVKVCSAKFTMELVRRAYPGLELAHLPSPPAAISPRPGTQYFSIGHEGPCWQTLVSTNEIGVYVPDALPDAELELSVLLES